MINAASREIETGVVDGVNLLVMDMAKCIRCGNCSLACHKVHGNSRLVRRGIHIERPFKPNKRSIQSVLVPTVCMHCQDPECLTGCPTGAIARFPSGEIDINAKTCIGCGDCATQCPYNAISMIARPDPKNANGNGAAASLLSAFSLREAKLPTPVEQTENLLAVKCNLCHETGMNPPGSKTEAYSCEENCPTGALVRVNPREYFDEINQAMGLIQRSKTHAIGENIHEFDLWATVWHVLGVIAVVIGGSVAVWATLTFTQDLPLSRRKLGDGEMGDRPHRIGKHRVGHDVPRQETDLSASRRCIAVLDAVSRLSWGFGRRPAAGSRRDKLGWAVDHLSNDLVRPRDRYRSFRSRMLYHRAALYDADRARATPS